ncbi:MAG: hypothetical protein ACOH1V_07100 [Stenotrophomonas sp.]
MPRRLSSTHHCWLLLSLCVVVLATGCRRDTAELPGAQTGPASAVRQLARYLKDDDLVGYARAAVPPAQYTRLEAAWRAGDSRWPLSELPLHEKLPGILATLSATDAETRLQRAFKAQIAGQAAGVRQAAHSLGLFGVQYLRSQGDYSPEQRAHYVQLVTALSDWAMAAPLSDPKLAQSAIGSLTAVARATGLDSDAAFQQAGMSGSLQRLGPVLHGVKQVLASYGLSLDQSLTQLRAGLVVERGDQATVRMQYPLAGKELDIQVQMVRLDGRWYMAQTLAEVETVLAAATAAEAARTGAAEAPPEVRPDSPEKPDISSTKP